MLNFGKKYLILLLIIFGSFFTSAQNNLKQISEDVFYKDTVLIRGDEVYNSFFFCNKPEDISIISIDSMEMDDPMLDTYPSTIQWKKYNDVSLHLSFRYPREKTVRKLTSETNPTYRIGDIIVDDYNNEKFQTNALITLTSNSFEKEIEGIFRKDGDMWIVEGWSPMVGKYFFGQNIKGIYGDQSIAIPLPEGGYAAGAESIFFIFVQLNKKTNAIIQNQDNVAGTILLQIAKTIRLK